MSEHTTTDLSAEELLAGTPYLIASGSAAQRKFTRIMEKAQAVQAQAHRVGAEIRQQAGEVFESFGLVLRSELVAESNRIERIEWTPQEVREEVLRHRDLLDLPAHVFVEAVRADERTYEALGLYRAQLLAEEWAETDLRPREIEIRQLHGLITAGASYAGRYKTAPNVIARAQHRPPAPAEAAEQMRELASWWDKGTGYPALDAAVIHAWLTHVHPFEDGNGRLSRLLANLALSQSEYPPLVIRADSDRGEYYDALAASDDGDILPLFDLFTRILRRTVRFMGQPEYAENVIRDRMLTTPSQQQRMWQRLAERFTTNFRSRLRREGFDATVQGYPSAAAFTALANANTDGNSWYLKVEDVGGQPRWLLWFGFNSYAYCDVHSGPSGYPSIFLAARAEDPDSIHPYRPLAHTGDTSIWTELILVPGRVRPAILLVGHEWQELPLELAAERAATLVLTATAHAG